MPAETVVATLECAGNSRVFLVPQMPGAQWELGAVGNAEWTGVPLATLLDRAGLTAKARDVVLEGADRGRPVEPPIPPEPISYSRSVPLDKALDDVLIAYAMNGVDLPHDHGFPVAGDRARPLRNGICQMADSRPRDRGAISGLLADDGLRILGRS